MKMKKIGLLTCYMDNYGACLQAYALQKKIESCNCTCDIVKYTPVLDIQEHSVTYKLYLKIKDVYRMIRYLNYSSILQRKKKFNEFRNSYLKFSDKYYKTIDSLYKEVEDYDGFVCGSDQIWNPLIHGNTNNKAYFLDFAKDQQFKIAYAPSIGISELPDNCKEEFSDLIKKFDFLSVREEQGAKIIKDLSDIEARVVLDPTLLLNQEEWRRISKEVQGIPKDYIFCYVFGDNEYIREYITFVKEQMGLPIVILPFNKKDFDNEENINLYDVGPNEFVWLIDNAKFVITDSFHATAFSINMNTPFYSLLRNKEGDHINMNSRIFNVLKMFNLEKRLMTKESDFDKTNFCLDFTISNILLKEKREKDFTFLREALSHGNNL